MSQNDVTMTVQRLDKMIEVLEHARIRPGMYFGLHPSSYHNFIRGFEMSRAILFDIQGFDEVYDETLQEHGFRKILPCDLYNQWCKLKFCDAFCVGARYIAPYKDILAR